MAKTLTVYLAADLKKFNQGIDDAGRKAQGLGGTMSNFLAPALIGAGVAAGALAVKLGVDGVQAAIDDEAAASKLAQTLENLGLAHDTAPVEDYISSLERSLGVADDELRPAYDRLVRSIGNTEGANRALALALDVSAGTGKSLDTVVQALGRAYDGNTAGLSRLGAGLDAATLRTGDMNAITTRLASTFSGQAQTSAQTFEGQIGRLSTAADNMKEAFGAGLLKALGDTNDATQGLVDAMEDLEPQLEAAGNLLGTVVASSARTYTQAIDRAGVSSADTRNQIEGLNKSGTILGAWLGELGASFTGPNSPIGVLSRLFGAASTEADVMATAIRYSAVAAERAVPGFQGLAGVMDDLGAESTDTAIRILSVADAMGQVGRQGAFNWRQEISGATDDAQNLSIELNYNAWAARQQAAAAAASAAANKSYGASSATAASDSDKLTAAQKRLMGAYEAQEGIVEGTRQQLAAYAADLAVVTEAANAYADSIRSSLMSTIDLGAAYGQQFDEEGQKTGQSLVKGFEAQIAQAEWFGNVLNELKRQGADATLISEIAGLGAGVGGALGQQLIDEGLVGTINDKWLGVQETVRKQAESLIPEFLTAGIASGEDLILGLTQELQGQVGTLGKIGKQIAKPVGAQFKAQIAADIAEAIRAVEAASSAARAEKVAQAERTAAALTEQAVAQALGNIIGRSDARTGRPVPGAPFLVFG